MKKKIVKVNLDMVLYLEVPVKTTSERIEDIVNDLDYEFTILNSGTPDNAFSSNIDILKSEMRDFEIIELLTSANNK